jgi:hypothetical protein
VSFLTPLPGGVILKEMGKKKDEVYHPPRASASTETRRACPGIFAVKEKCIHEMGLKFLRAVFVCCLLSATGCYSSGSSTLDAGPEGDPPANDIVDEEFPDQAPPDGPLPVCSGPATDLPPGSDCSGAWIHGEQKCPLELWCGYSVSWCLAYAGWQEGSCVCEPEVDICCPLEFREHPDGAVIMQEDDVRAWQPGIQLSIEVSVNCWSADSVAVFICGGPDPETAQYVFLEPAGDGLGTAILDLGEDAEGCIDLCAHVQANGLDMVVLSEEISVCIQET